MRWVEPKGHVPVVERLWRAARESRLPHALLFEGPAGVGKFEAARFFAAGLLCADGPAAPCGRCGPCKRVASGGAQGNHADLLLVDPLEEGEEQIRIGRIADRAGTPAASSGGEAGRSIEVFLGLRALEGGRRAVLIREGHRMNSAAQNALLKTLEEPRPGTVLVIETHRTEELLPTLLSRCVRIRFAGLPTEEACQVLAEHGLIGPEAERLSRWAAGSPGQALALRARGAEAMRAALEACFSGTRSARSVHEELWELEGEFEGKTPTARARERARTVLDLALAIVRDRIRLAAGLEPDELPHGDLAARLSAPAGGAGGEQRFGRLVDCLLEARSDVERNLEPQAVLERALLVSGDPVPIL